MKIDRADTCKLSMSIYDNGKHYSINAKISLQQKQRDLKLILTSSAFNIMIQAPWSLYDRDDNILHLKSRNNQREIKLSYSIESKSRLLPRDLWYPLPIQMKYMLFEIEASSKAPDIIIINGNELKVRGWGDYLSTFWRGYGLNIALLKKRKPTILDLKRIIAFMLHDLHTGYSALYELGHLLTKLNNLISPKYSRVIVVDDEEETIIPPLITFNFKSKNIANLYFNSIAAIIGADPQDLEKPIIKDLCSYILYRLGVYRYLSSNLFKLMELKLGEEKILELISKSIDEIVIELKDIEKLLNLSTSSIPQVIIDKEYLKVRGRGVYMIKVLNQKMNIRSQYIIPLKDDEVELQLDGDVRLVLIKPL